MGFFGLPFLPWHHLIISHVKRPLGFGPGGVLEALERKLLESPCDGGLFGGLGLGLGVIVAGQGSSSTVWVGAEIHGDNLRLDHPPQKMDPNEDPTDF